MKSFVVLALVFAAACGPSGRNGSGGDDTPTPVVCPACSPDNSAVVDCDGTATACPTDQQCSNAQCMPACQAAEENHASIGCDYYAVDMDAAEGPPRDACFAVFVANTSRGQVHMNVDFGGTAIDLAQFAHLPQGSGTSLQLGAYDPAAGLAPGQVAIMFLGYAPGGGLQPHVACPLPAAIGTEAQITGYGIGKAFHLVTDLPVVAYQMLPYGGGAAATTGASLLLPTSAWSTSYVAATAYDELTGSPPPISFDGIGQSMNIVAKEDNTTVTMRPTSDIAGGNGIPAASMGGEWTMTLNKGEYAQLTQFGRLSGSPLSADKPIGVFGGHTILSVDRCCGDHAEQMIAPVRALGYQYVAAPHGDRKPTSEERVYRIIGAVNNTQLTYDPPGIGPSSVNLGQILEVRSATPFVVTSQGPDNPFMMFTYMTGAGETGEGGLGDADFVRLVPPQQYQLHYVFFTDPTYPFTVLTVVRQKKDGVFADVTLQCHGLVEGWTPVGNGDFEIAQVRLVDHWNGLGGTCNNGVNIMDSAAPFGLWVWGWGSEDTNTGWVSYGYPAGEGVLPINDVIIQ